MSVAKSWMPYHVGQCHPCPRQQTPRRRSPNTSRHRPKSRLHKSRPKSATSKNKPIRWKSAWRTCWPRQRRKPSCVNWKSASAARPRN